MVAVALEELAVAKKRTKPSEPEPKPDAEPERQPVVLTMSGRPEWKTWLKKLSRYFHLEVSV